MSFVPWNKTKWAKHNVEQGLRYSEICPGVTVGEHSESLAMFLLKDSPADNAYTLALAVLTDSILNDFYEAGYDNPLGE